MPLMQPMVRRALKTKDTLKIFLHITQHHLIPINHDFIGHYWFISKKSTSTSENLLARASYLDFTIKQLGHKLKRVNGSLKSGQYILMNTLKIVGKAASFFGSVCVVFAVILVFVTYRLIQIVNATTTPPMDYVVLSILASVLPYLFLAVVSLVIAYVLRGVGKESVEIEEDEEVPPTPVQPAEPVA
jgi:hypothetical protein